MKNLVKIISFMLVAILLFNCAITKPIAHANTTAQEIPPINIAAIANVIGNNTVNVSLKITVPEGVDVGGLQVELLYDTANFTTEDDFDSNGAIVFVKETIAGGQTQTLNVFSMKANEEIFTGYYYVAINSVLVYDDSEQNNELPYTTSDAEFIIQGEEPEIYVTMSNTALTLLKGSSKTLTATVWPENALDKTITWNSDNAAVATVSASGEVTAVSEGTANIYANCADTAAICTVTVFESNSSVVMFERAPYKRDYFVGEKADALGMKLRVFTDSTNSVVVDSGWEISHKPFGSPGSYTVTVDYCGYILNYTVNVVEPSEESAQTLSVYSLPEKDVYKMSELYYGLYPRLYGLGFVGEDGLPRYFNLTASNITVALSKPTVSLGKNTLIITYDTFNFYVDFIVVADDAPDSIEVASAPAGAPMFGSKVTSQNTWGLSVNSITGGEKTAVNLNDITFPTRRLDTAGDNVIELNYMGRLAYYTVYVEKPGAEAAEGISVVSAPLKTVYKPGEELQLAGLSVGLLFNGCVFETITNYTVDPITLRLGKNTVTVRYGEFSTNFTVTVKEEVVIVPTTITSDVYAVANGYLTVLNATEVTEFISNINEGEFITVFDKNGNALSGSDFVPTQARAAIIDPATGEQIAAVTVIVIGDINGDGIIDSDDFNTLKQYLLGTCTLNDNQILAADITRNKTTDISDLVNLRDIIR